jgi:opacity protein-like surface antigen
MKRILLSALICILFTLSLRAQDVLQHVTVAVGAGFSFPTATAADHTKTGFNFVASGGPRFNHRLSLALDFSLHYLDVKNSFQSPESNTDLSLGSIMRLWSLTVNPSYEFITRERFSSYATGGYGLYNRTLLLAASGPVPVVACNQFWNVCVSSPLSSGSVTGDLGPYKSGYNVGGGVTFGSYTKFFAEVRYHHMFTPNAPTTVVPLTFGIRW